MFLLSLPPPPSSLSWAADKGELLPPLEVRRLDVDLGVVQQVCMKAGSVCVFTEALCQCAPLPVLSLS